MSNFVVLVLFISSLRLNVNSFVWALSGYPEIHMPHRDKGRPPSSSSSSSSSSSTGASPAATSTAATSTAPSGAPLQGVILNYVAPKVDGVHMRRDVAGNDSTMEGVVWSPQAVSVHNARLWEYPTTTTATTNTATATATTTATTTTTTSSRTFTASHWLDRQGAALVNAPLGDDNDPIDFLDSQMVVDRYYPMCEQLLCQQLLLSEKSDTSTDPQTKHRSPTNVTVVAFDHNVRMAAPPSVRWLKNAAGATIQDPLAIVHGDYTAVSAPRRLQDLAQPPKHNNDVWRSRVNAPSSQDNLSLLNATQVQQALAGKRRYAFINVWRSIDRDYPVTSTPLAMCNAQTVALPHDLRTLQIHYADRIGENYLVVPSPRHEWFFYPDMTFQEAILLKQWDSAAFACTNSTFSPWMSSTQNNNSHNNNDTNNNNNDNNNNHHTTTVAPFAVHTAFALPENYHSDNNANNKQEPSRPRQSIEVRCVCIWDIVEEEDHSDDQS